MTINGIIVARKTVDDLLLNEDAARFSCAWDDLRSADNQQVRIEWSAQVVCVDSPADRALLSERFFSASDCREITPTHISRFLNEEIATAIKRFVLTQDAPSLVDGTLDVKLSEVLAEQARKAAFAAGMAILPPFTLRTESPSLERAHKLSQVQERLDAMAQSQTSRAAMMSELTRRLSEKGTNTRVLDGLHLADPLDLFRAASVADPTWSLPTPALRVAVGASLVPLVPMRPTLPAPTGTPSSELGAIRSVRAARVNGSQAIIVGGREGVALLKPDSLEPIATFKHGGASEFGFNAGGVLEEDRTVLATHSDYGCLRWKLDGAGQPETLASGAARSLIVLSSRLAVFAEVNVLKWVASGRGVESGLSGTSMIVEIAELPDKLLAIAYADRSIAIVDANAGPSAQPMCRIRMLAPIVSICGMDLCGLPRVVATMTDGTLRAIDPFNCDVVSVGPTSYAARAVRARAGWIALSSADRTRIGMIDLTEPNKLASEVHLTATYGNRVADLWFA